MMRCRICHRNDTEVRFGPLVVTRCASCHAIDRAQRRERRKSRVVDTDLQRIRNRQRLARQHVGESTRHLAWVRTYPCCVRICGATMMHVHHVRDDSGGGTGLRPHDRWAIPVCPAHHMAIHQTGARTFETRHGLNLRAIAVRFAETSPYLPSDEKTEPGD